MFNEMMPVTMPSGNGGHYASKNVNASTTATTYSTVDNTSGIPFTPKTAMFIIMSDTNASAVYFADNELGINKCLYKPSYTQSPQEVDLPTSGYGDFQIVDGGIQLTVPNSHWANTGRYAAYD